MNHRAIDGLYHHASSTIHRYTAGGMNRRAVGAVCIIVHQAICFTLLMHHSATYVVHNITQLAARITTEEAA
jgi:hypothetical protein